MNHPIDPTIVEAIESMAMQAAANSSCTKEEVVETWTTWFHQHAASAEERAFVEGLEAAAKICDTHVDYAERMQTHSAIDRAYLRLTRKLAAEIRALQTP